MGVDLEGAGLYAQCSGLERRTSVPVDDARTYASPPELIGEHEPGRPGSDDQDVSIHVSYAIPQLHPVNDAADGLQG